MAKITTILDHTKQLDSEAYLTLYRHFRFLSRAYRLNFIPDLQIIKRHI